MFQEGAAALHVEKVFSLILINSCYVEVKHVCCQQCNICVLVHIVCL